MKQKSVMQRVESCKEVNGSAYHHYDLIQNNDVKIDLLCHDALQGET